MQVELDNETIELMFAGINIFWARPRLILARAVRRRLKGTFGRAQNTFMPKASTLTELLLLMITITLEGIGNIKTEKKLQHNSLRNISFANTVRKRPQTL